MKKMCLIPSPGPSWLALGVVCSLGLALPPAQAQDLDPNATEVLQFMSDYLAETEALSFNADIDFEVIATNGQKLQFSSYASVLLNRPNGLHIRRQGPLADVDILFDGDQLTLFGRRINAYVQQAFMGTVDEAILAVEADTGIPFPGADLLFSNTYEVLMEGVTSSQYLGTGYIDGVEVHHLAFREDDVDWQIWVQTGDRPLPMKYVITTKWVTGAPQYETRLRDWNTNPSVGQDSFTFTAPTGTRQLEALPPSQLEDFQPAEEAQS